MKKFYLISNLMIILFLSSSTITNAQTWVSLGDTGVDGGDLLLKNEGRLFTSGLINGPLFYKDTDEGEWSSTDWESAGNKISGFCLHNGELYVMGNTTFHKSADNGDTWEDLSANIPNTSGDGTNDLDSFGGNLYASVFNEGIYESSDNGMTWALINDRFDNENIATSVYKMEETPDGILIASFYGVALSTDDAASFDSLIENDFSYFNDVDYYNNSFYAISNSEGLYKSEDSGVTWALIKEVVAGKSIYVNNDRIFIGGQNELLFSDDEGESWTDIYSSTIGEFIFGIYTEGDYVYISSYTGGVYRADLSVLGVEDVSESIASNFSLERNPAVNSLTVINNNPNFSINKPLTVNIISSHGGLVHSTSTMDLKNIDISKLSNGIYFLNFMVENEVVNLKFIKK